MMICMLRIILTSFLLFEGTIIMFVCIQMSTQLNVSLHFTFIYILDIYLITYYLLVLYHIRASVYVYIRPKRLFSDLM